MRVCACSGAHPEEGTSGARTPSPLLSVILLLGDGARDLQALLAQTSALLSKTTAHELIVVASGLDARACDSVGRLRAPAGSALRVFLLTRALDPHVAAWRGIENARGGVIAVLDAATDDVTFLPELLRRAAAGVDLVFAHATDPAPPRLRRAVARRLLQGAQRSLGVTPIGAAAPVYRVLRQQVVHFIAQHPDPVAAYRRLPSGGSFARVHLQYTPARRGAPEPALQRAARRGRRWAQRTLDTLTSLRGHDATFHDPERGDSTGCLVRAPALRRGAFDIPAPLREPGPRYHPMNPTLARSGGQVWVNVRLVNYRKRGHGSTLSGDAVYRSRNLVFEWCPRTGLGGSVREVDGVPPSWARDTRVRGLEDQRWVSHEGRMWFSACCSQVPHQEGCARMVLGRMSERLDAVELLLPLRYDAAREAEKNWLLWPVAGALLAIYGYHPLTLLALDATTGQARPFRTYRTPAFARALRGSAGPIPLPERPGHWLLLAHEVAPRLEQPVYAHRWLLLELEHGIVAYSRPFVFEHVGIEYAAGLLDNGDGTLTVTYGVGDRDARWAVLDRAGVLASLYALPAPPTPERAPREPALEAALP